MDPRIGTTRSQIDSWRNHMMKSIRSIAGSLTIVVCGAFLSLMPAFAQEEPHLTCQATGGCFIAATNTLGGTWKGTGSPDGIPPFRAYNVFMADRNNLGSDKPKPAGGRSSAGGPWTKTGINTYS